MVRIIFGPTNGKGVDAAWSEKDLKQHFLGFDSNSDGKLSFNELREALKKLGDSIFRSYFNTVGAMDYADGNNDECINLYGQEFIDLVKHIFDKCYKIEQASR